MDRGKPLAELKSPPFMILFTFAACSVVIFLLLRCVLFDYSVTECSNHVCFSPFVTGCLVIGAIVVVIDKLAVVRLYPDRVERHYAFLGGFLRRIIYLKNANIYVVYHKLSTYNKGGRLCVMRKGSYMGGIIFNFYLNGGLAAREKFVAGCKSIGIEFADKASCLGFGYLAEKTGSVV